MEADIGWILPFEDFSSSSLLLDAAATSLLVVQIRLLQSFLAREVLAVPLVHLVPMLLLALLAAVGDLVAPGASLQGADCRVRLLPTKNITVGTSPLKGSHLRHPSCHSHRWSR